MQRGDGLIAVRCDNGVWERSAREVLGAHGAEDVCVAAVPAVVATAP